MNDKLKSTRYQADTAPTTDAVSEVAEQSEYILKPGTIAYKFAQSVLPELVLNQEDVTDVPTNRP